MSEQILAQEAREDWKVGSAVEIFSNSAQDWYPGWVVQVEPNDSGSEVMKVLFDDSSSALKSKLLLREDPKLAPMGTNVKRLPPEFVLSGGGEGMVGAPHILHPASNRVATTLQQAWRIYFELFFRGGGQKKEPSGAAALPGAGSIAPAR